eukprot:2287083-Prymnesium_polylepis.1
MAAGSGDERRRFAVRAGGERASAVLRRRTAAADVKAAASAAASKGQHHHPPDGCTPLRTGCTPLRTARARSYESIDRNLVINHEGMLQMLELWEHYQHFQLCSLTSLPPVVAMELERFKDMQHSHWCAPARAPAARAPHASRMNCGEACCA